MYKYMNINNISDINAFDLREEIRILEDELNMLNAYSKLKNNPEFIKVIKKQYLTKEPLKIIHKKATIRNNSTQAQSIDDMLNEKINAIAIFQNWLDGLGPDRKSQIEEQISELKQMITVS